MKPWILLQMQVLALKNVAQRKVKPYHSPSSIDGAESDSKCECKFANLLHIVHNL